MKRYIKLILIGLGIGFLLVALQGALHLKTFQEMEHTLIEIKKEQNL